MTDDLISRQAVIDELKAMAVPRYKDLECEDAWERDRTLDRAIDVMRKLPPAQPTLSGYKIDQLILIADLLRERNLPPDRVVDALTDISNIVRIVTNEFERNLRKALGVFDE